MSDYEQRFVDRLAAKELIRGLPDRERRFIIRSYIHGETYKEIGGHAGISAPRVATILNRAERLLRGRAKPRPPLQLPQRVRAPTVAEIEFDRARFLEHMRKVKARRDYELAQERETLDRLLADEAKPTVIPQVVDALMASTKPVPSLKPTAPYPAFVYHQPVVTKVQAIEPWFDPVKDLTLAYLTEIARYALAYFCAVNRPAAYGIAHIGSKIDGVWCRRDADSIAGALKRFSDSLTHKARLSARPLEAPPDWDGLAVGVCIPFHVGIRVLASHDGREVGISFSWDVGHG